MRDKPKQIFRMLSGNPLLDKALLGDLKGFYSIRLSNKDRIVYFINLGEVEIYVLRIKTHYGE